METEKKEIPSKFYLFCLTLYLVLSVVNWLPIISAELIKSIKYFLFLFIFIYEIKSYGLKYPSFYLSPRGLILLIISMSFGLFLSFNFNTLVDVILPFIFLWIFNFPKEYYYRCIYNASIVIVIICVFSIFSYYTGIFNILANGPWNSTFGKAAFAGYSTGYSNSLFLFVPFLVFRQRSYNKKILSIETLAIIIIIIAQYVAGGRAGLLSSLLVFLLGYNISIIYKIIIIAMFIPFTQSEEFLVQMRIVNAYGDEIDSDRISSGRIGLGNYHLEKFYDNPIFGYGFGEKIDIDEIDVHIVWLKNAVNGGVFYVFFLLLIFISVLIKVISNRFYLTSEEFKLFIILFTISFLITFLEPNYLIGSVQGEFVYWLIISLMLKKISNLA